jgi:hypothetical protein
MVTKDPEKDFYNARGWRAKGCTVGIAEIGFRNKCWPKRTRCRYITFDYAAAHLDTVSSVRVVAFLPNARSIKIAESWRGRGGLEIGFTCVTSESEARAIIIRNLYSKLIIVTY